MTFAIQPYVGAGDLKLGMTMDEIRRAMKSPHQSYMKSAKVPTDMFRDGSVHVYYNDSVVCEAIEFYGNVEVLLESRNLLGVPYSEAKNLATKLDNALEEDDAGFTSHKMGIGVYAPSCIESPDDPTESVIVFAEGYYD